MADTTERGKKELLPKKRPSEQFSMHVGGHKILFRVGKYTDGRIGEIFIDMNKVGSGHKSILTCFAIAVSIGLQHGVPMERFVDAFVHTRFEPNGVTDYEKVRVCSSPLDAIFRVIGSECLGREDLESKDPLSQRHDDE